MALYLQFGGQEGTTMLRKLSRLLLVLLLISAAIHLRAEIRIDYDHSADFHSYKTYSWIKVQAGNSLWDDRITRDVDAQLAARGWTRVESNGDVAVSAFRSTQEQPTLETFYDGFGGGWRWRGFGGEGLATTTTENTKVGNVVVDLFDAHSHMLLWRAQDTQDLSSNTEKNIRALEKGIDQMFRKFPSK